MKRDGSKCERAAMSFQGKIKLPPLLHARFLAVLLGAGMLIRS